MKKRMLAALSTAALISGFGTETAHADTYTVQKGDTLSQISLKYHTSILEIKRINGLNSDNIFVNQKLNFNSVNSSSIKSVNSASIKTVSSSYTIVKGDTLSKIAVEFNTSVSNLKQWNGLNSELIFPGQILKVQSSVNEKKTAPVQSSVPVQPVKTQEYIVKSGDTLSKIALQNKLTVQVLKKLNNLSSDVIYIGQKLKLLGNITETPAPQPSKAMEYIVKSGDTLGKIAPQYGMTVSELKKLNNLNTDIIYVGQNLKLSGTPAETPIPTAIGQSNLLLIQEAKNVLGTPYVWGGTTATGFDCSGFIYYVFNKAGISIKRYSSDGYYNRSYYVNTPEPGDLVFFENTYKQGISHMGIYLGNNQFIHADETKGITITDLSNSYYKKHFDGFKRFY